MFKNFRWEYCRLAKSGDFIWKYGIDPLLTLFVPDEIVLFRVTRGATQVILLIAVLLLPLACFFNPSHLFTASGLLFDIAGALRLFLFDEIIGAFREFRPNRDGNLPSVAMRELVMPEDTPFDESAPWISGFLYKKRGVLFLFVGFVLQMIGDLVG
jgi:hypothetical protein